MKIVFEKGDRGFICRSPEDRGAWVIPTRPERHAAQPVDGHVVDVEIVGASANGKIRFARILKDISASQDAEIEKIKVAAKNAATFDEMNKKWGDVSVVTHISPWRFNVQTCLDVEGRPAIKSVKVTGVLEAEYGRVQECTRWVELERTLPLGQDAARFLGYHVVAMATEYTRETPPEWAAEFVENVGELSKLVRLLEERTSKKWYPRPTAGENAKDWPVMAWLQDEATRMGANNLCDLIAQVELPLDVVKAQLAALTTDRPTAVRLSDGQDWTVKWSGESGSVWVPREVFSALEINPADQRAAAVKAAGFSLQLETSWREWSEGDRHNDMDSHHVRKCRQLI